MVEDGWTGVSVRNSLIEVMDRVIKKTKDDFGVPRYTSRPDFVERAIIQLLKVEEREVPAR